MLNMPNFHWPKSANISHSGCTKIRRSRNCCA